jgi:hypothetical protein
VKVTVKREEVGVAPPSGLKAACGDKVVNLNWNLVTGATGYKVYRGPVKGGPYTFLADAGNATTYKDTTVANGTTYYYVATALKDTIESPHSNEVSATPPFSFAITPTTVFFWGNAKIDDIPVEIGDIVAAFAPGVVVNGGCIGTYKVDTPEIYGVLAAYGDDPTTPEKDGAAANDTISFKIWDASKDSIWDATALGPDEAKWTADNDIRNVNLEGIGIEEIPLMKGWNLISFRTNTCFYVGSPPANTYRQAFSSLTLPH